MQFILNNMPESIPSLQEQETLKTFTLLLEKVNYYKDEQSLLNSECRDFMLSLLARNLLSLKKGARNVCKALLE